MGVTIVIYNPACGDGNAKSFFDEQVIPILERSSISISRIVSTKHADDAGDVIRETLEATPVDETVTVVLGSGDGTLHEIINHLSNADLKGSRTTSSAPPRIQFALIPCGTANALYASLFPPPSADSISDNNYKLQSVQSFIKGSSLVPLTLAITTLSSPPPAKVRPKAVASSVVVSTCLHAAILHDSESLRASMPGIERFKVAAEQNSKKWYYSNVKLFPAASESEVQIYNPETKSFVSHPDADEDDPIVELQGPFSYFLSTVNVDRLEPAFRITPLAREIAPPEATCDLVIVRPLRDPSLTMDTEEARARFVPKLWAVMGGAYQQGSHVNLRYDEKGEVTPDGEGPFVVEYIRCGGWEWAPDDIDDGAHLVCTDGAISHVEKGGRAVCLAAKPQENSGFTVHV